MNNSKTKFNILADFFNLKGFSMDKQDRSLLKYVHKELSMMEVCQALKWDPWELLAQLKARNLYLNVELEDWLDSSELPS